MTADLEWTTEPPALDSGRGRSGSERWATVARELRARPGEWAIVQRGNGDRLRSTATNIGSGSLAAFRPARTFQAVSRKQPDSDEVVIYARFVGNGAKP